MKAMRPPVNRNSLPPPENPAEHFLSESNVKDIIENRQ
jgi:hypothetical protein